MSRTIAQIKTKITSRLHGTTLNKISDFNLICQDAAELMLSRIDPVETTRKAVLVNPVYDSVFDYSLPSDFKSPADLVRQANADTNNNSSLQRTFAREFVNRKKSNQFAVIWRDMVQFLRFSSYINTPLVIDRADSITENGTWTVGGNGSNLVVDTINYVAGSGSLKAAVSSSGAVVNVVVAVGNDSSNYFYQTLTTGHFEAFKQGWNLLRFDFSSATQVGTVDMSTIDYVKVTFTYNTVQTAYFTKTLTNGVNLSENYDSDGSVFLYTYFDSLTSLTFIRIDNIVASLGTLFEMTYYSNYLFRTAGGTWIDKPTLDTDLVNLSPVSYKIFEAEISRIITQQVQGAMGVFDFTYWNTQLEGADGTGETSGLYFDYGTQYPSERMDGSTSYYDTSGNMDDFGYANQILDDDE
mgnify:CR=1 FL=1